MRNREPMNGIKISVVYSSDNVLSTDGISFLLKSTPQLDLLDTFTDTELLDEFLMVNDVNVLLFEIGTNSERIEEIIKLKQTSPSTKLIVISAVEDQTRIVQILKYGADGYILASSSPVEIIKSVSDVYYGGLSFSPLIIKRIMEYFRSSHKHVENYMLTKREEEIVDGLSKGYSYKMIADQMGIKLDTVRSHIRRVYDKMDVNSRTQVILKTLEAKR